MYLADTIIFGGGPVVIPLLRDYVVQPGWVSTRDFLTGLAIILAFQFRSLSRSPCPSGHAPFHRARCVPWLNGYLHTRNRPGRGIPEPMGQLEAQTDCDQSITRDQWHRCWPRVYRSVQAVADWRSDARELERAEFRSRTLVGGVHNFHIRWQCVVQSACSCGYRGWRTMRSLLVRCCWAMIIWGNSISIGTSENTQGRCTV